MHEEVQKHLDLSREYVEGARAAYDRGALAPARFLCIHALELGLKAALAKRIGTVPQTHNVGGLFGREFGGVVGAALARRLNQLLEDYNGPRYPDWEPPRDIHGDIEFVTSFLLQTLPPLLEDRA